jgi:hypothetical protein
MHLAAAIVLLLSWELSAAPKWNLAYFHDEDESKLHLRALAFTDAQRGIAVGILADKGGTKGVALLTADGGAKWSMVRLRDEPLAISCVADVCWYTSGRAVWRSEEGGREWKKVSSQKGILQLHFVSEKEGWAAGTEKSAWSTVDGGATWKAIDAAAKIAGNPRYSQFNVIAFQGRLGLIVGNSRPPRPDTSLFPDWMVPEEAAKRRELPGLMMTLDTRDGGKNWTSATASVFGLLTRLRIQPGGIGAVALLEYLNDFETPSEVMWIDFRTGSSKSIYRDKKIAVTDLWPFAGGSVIFAGTENTTLRSLPVPQKIRISEAVLHNEALSTIWVAHEVDYRAVAKRVTLAAAPDGRLFAVTDTGMILRLDRVANAK